MGGGTSSGNIKVGVTGEDDFVISCRSTWSLDIALC